MSNVLAGVDERTRLVGHNRMELLLFRLDGKQRYGINVFKVREVIQCPPLTAVPNSHPAVRGITNLRGQTISVIDLQFALGKPPVEDPSQCSVIVTEYNRKMQGFLVPQILHIINKHWEEMQLPPRATGRDHYLTAVTQYDDGELVEILDVEKVLYTINGEGPEEDIPEDIVDGLQVPEGIHVLAADDSMVARNQIKRALETLGVEYTLVVNGAQALAQLQHWRDEEPGKLAKLALVISDVEMPEMDGYTLTAEIRKDPALRGLKILLHTSLSGVFDSSLLEDIKADGFLSKFEGADLAGFVRQAIEEFVASQQAASQ